MSAGSSSIDAGPLPSLASGAPRTKFEQLKADSDHLKQPLLEELGNELPNFSEGAVQILKFHGSYQQDNRDNRQKGQDKDWQMMLRLRSPGGRIPAALFLALDELADRYGNGTLRATTRQAWGGGNGSVLTTQASFTLPAIPMGTPGASLY